jgi:nitrous oxidase accessory protein
MPQPPRLDHSVLALLLACLLFAGADAAAQSPNLQARIEQAARGDTLVVDGGTHDGPFVVDRPLTLLGRGRPVLRGDSVTHTVRISAADVTLQGFAITRSGTRLNQDHAGVLITGDGVTLRDNRLRGVLHGIYVKGADDATITGNRVTGIRRLPRPQRGNGIHLWKSTGNRLAANDIAYTRDGVYFSFADHTVATENVVHDVRYGLHFMYSDDNRFTGNVFTDNVSGSALMYSSGLTARNNVFRDNRTQNGYGLLLQTMTGSTFENNRLTGNMTGLYLENSSRSIFRGNTIRANYRGLRFTGSSGENRFTENVVQANLQTAALSGSAASNRWSVDGRGNYWGRSGLLDLDADGVSELPRRVVDVLSAVGGEDFPYAGLLASSPAVDVLAFALRRAGVPGLPSITDPNPLMAPPGEK